MHIGIDFDNTIVNYDSLFYQCAEELNLTGPGVRPSKASVRDHIRPLENGETKWQKLQAIVYCHRMSQAGLMRGVTDFFRICRNKDIKLTIVSHKTKTAAQDIRANIRKAAFDWMSDQGFFTKPEFGFSESDIFFESTRDQKIKRISDLGCTHFIDDLIEVLSDKLFPKNVIKILISKEQSILPRNGIVRFSTWCEVCNFLFNTAEQ